MRPGTLRLPTYALALAILTPGARASTADPPVTSQDARLALQIAAGLTPASAPNVARADISSPAALTPDNRITILDAVRLLRIARGVRPIPPGGTALLRMFHGDIFVLDRQVERHYILARGFLVRGRITDEAGRPAEGNVRIVSKNANEAAGPGGDGTFTMRAPGDSYTAEVSRSENFTDPETGLRSFVSVTEPQPAPLRLDRDAEVTFRRPPMPPLGTVTGRITGGDFVPTSVTLCLWPDEGGSVFATGPTRGDQYALICGAGKFGNMEISGYLAGDPAHRLAANLAGPDVAAGARLQHDITLPRMERLEVVITPPDGFRVKGIHLRTKNGDRDTLPYFDDGADFRKAGVLASGPARAILALPEGEYEADVDLEPAAGPDGANRSWRQWVTIPPGGGSAAIDVPAAPALQTFRGRVTDAAGVAVVGGEVSVGADPWRKVMPGYSIWATLRTDESGSFSTRLPANTYVAWAGPGGL